MQRQECPFESHGARFIVTKKEYTRQYQHVYYQRLIAMRPSVIAAAASKWGSGGT